MAKVNFYHADIVGKVGGLVYQRGSSGAVLRTKGLSVDPFSPAQSLQRALCFGLQKAWGNALSQDQRDAWSNLAATTPVKDAFGNTVYLSGINWYLRVNTNVLRAGQARKDAAPVNLDVSSGTSLSVAAVVAGATEISVSFAPALGAQECEYIQFAGNLSAGISRPEYSPIEFPFSDPAQPSPGIFEIQRKYQPLVEGTRYFVFVRRYNQINGIMSPGILVTGLVGPAVP